MLPSTNEWYKMRQAIWNKNQTMPPRQEPVLNQSPREKGLSDLQNLIRGLLQYIYLPGFPIQGQ